MARIDQRSGRSIKLAAIAASPRAIYRRFNPRLLVWVSALLVVVGALAWAQPGAPPDYLRDMPQQAGALGNPANLVGVAGANGQITLTWAVAANADTHWVYQVRADGTGSGRWHQGSGSLEITGLENNVSYSFIVIATRTVDGNSEWSAWSNWVTVKAVLSVPNPPGRYDAIDAGKHHTCAIRHDQTLDCWGDDARGQATPPTGQFRMVSAGGNHSCGITVEQGLVCWGDQEVVKKVPKGTFLAVSAGDEHACAITTLDNDDHNSIICWGAPDAAGRTDNRHRVKAWTKVSAGYEHNCAVEIVHLAAWCWGSNENNRLHLGDRSEFRAGAISISAGGFHSCRVHPDNSILCGGSNLYGQVVPPSAEDEGASEAFYTYTAVSAGGVHTCGLRAEGNVRCWGNNDYGQSTPPGDNDELRADDPGVGDFIAVSAGGLHTCGLRQGGTVVCWGDNSYGQAPSWPR